MSFDWEAHDTLIAAHGITIDRPRFSRHPHFPEIVYPIDYGYINHTRGEDGDELDVFVGTGASGLVGVMRTIDHRKGDTELKLLFDCTPAEIYLVNGFINFAPELMEGRLTLRRPAAGLWDDTPMASHLHHLDLNVLNLAASRAFYAPLMAHWGYRRSAEWEAGCAWRKGDFYLTLVQTEAAHTAAGYHRKRAGVNHLAFAAPTAEAVREFYSRYLLPAGIPVLYGGPRDEGDGGLGVFFEDPDRLKLEYVYHPWRSRPPLA